MIDLEKLRERVQGKPTDQGVYGPTWLNPREALALLNHIAQLEKDAGIGKVARKAISELEDSPISFMKTIRRSIDTAIEAKHG